MINSEIEDEIISLKNKILELEKKVEIFEFIKKIKIPLFAIAKELGISKQALTYHVKKHYKPQEEFYIEDNKILLDMSILKSIKEYYDAK